ncbi:hypothetical protein FDY98_12955 [Halomonas sp. PA16-9]|nr:hypothetical protein FDY98_12955 [Halomonas sp. PA16-9]
MSDFLLPDIGEGIVECEVVEWRVAEGDQIEEDQPIVEVMTDKALVEITAPEAGVVTKLYVAQGQIAKVHAPLYAYQVMGLVTIIVRPNQTVRNRPPVKSQWHRRQNRPTLQVFRLLAAYMTRCQPAPPLDA